MKLLKFEASWCQPCKQLSRAMESVEFPFPVEAIDIDKYNDVALEYGVRGVPCMILVDENHNQLKRITGARTPVQLQQDFADYMK
jgi:thioredoxin-like negative regulator of GroEL